MKRRENWVTPDELWLDELLRRGRSVFMELEKEGYAKEEIKEILSGAMEELE